MESLVRGYQVWWVLDQSVIEDQVRSVLVKEIHKQAPRVQTREMSGTSNQQEPDSKGEQILNFLVERVEAKLYIFSLLQERELGRFFPPGRVGAELEIS